MQNKVVGLCSFGALIGFGAWFCKEPSYEPAIGFITSIGFLAANYHAIGTRTLTLAKPF